MKGNFMNEENRNMNENNAMGLPESDMGAASLENGTPESMTNAQPAPREAAGAGEMPTVPPETEAPGAAAKPQEPDTTAAPAEAGAVEAGEDETGTAETGEIEAGEAEAGIAESGSAEALATLAFDFGKNASSPAVARGGARTFAILFGVVTGVCAILLFLTLWLGNSGFRIIRQVETDRTVYVREYDSESGLLTPNEVADIGRRSTVTVSVSTTLASGIGSGFVYSANGYIVTNYHVIENAVGNSDAGVQVIFADGTAVDATIVGYDEMTDVAVLQVPVSDDLVPAVIGSSGDLLTGDSVVAIGTPANLNYAGTATFGAVSAPKRLVALTSDDGSSIERKMTLIQTDASVNPGNSGGPLLDMYGKVVGIVVMKVTQYGGTVFDGIGFAIPIDGAKTVIDAIIADGAFRGESPVSEGRSLLGVTGHGGSAGYWYPDTVNAISGKMDHSETEEPGYHYMPASGVYVMQVNGANSLGKIREGDVIMRVNGLIVQDTTSLIDVVNRHYIGETVTLTIYRDGAEHTVEIVLAGE